jgi:hypothetical protein
VLPTRGPSELPQNSALLGNTTGATNPNLTDGYHEIIEPPSTAINPATGAVWVDPLASTDASSPSERYYYQAGVKILLTGNRSSPTVSVLNLSGSTVTSASTGANKDIYSAFSPAVSSPAVTTNGNLYDNRQGALIPLTTIDISKILSTLNTGGALAQDDVHANIVYIDDETSAPGGVELINGSTIPANGLTVVSANPVYIQGDYNTGGTGSAVGSNSGSPTVDYVSGYTPQPCAVMADAVTILSNSWVNSSSSRNGNVSNASNTTINTAILSGIVMPESTNSATYSGAVENFPRLLENWDSRTPQNTFTYFGSMVELFQSRQATGIYQEPGTNSPHYYGIPIRQWYFDTRFYSAPPPGTFKVITYIKSRWFIQ